MKPVNEAECQFTQKIADVCMIGQLLFILFQTFEDHIFWSTLGQSISYCN